MHQISLQKESPHLSVRLSGSMTDEDGKKLTQAIKTAVKRYPLLDLLFILEKDFKKWQGEGMWPPFKAAINNKEKIRKIALVASRDWEVFFVNVDKPITMMLGIEERFFPLEEIDSAAAWVSS